ncbi:MAG TPA: tetratricopeptide repeat protein [Patescibacteria group bacterium]|nr:tetratricopeptide repeat protein [Patescibacteria group bacterium]
MLVRIISLLIICATLIMGASYAQESKEQEAFFVARKAFADGFYDVSLQLLDRFMSNYPASTLAAQASLLTGQCYFHQGKFLEALAKFEGLQNQPAAKDIQDAVDYWIAEVHFRGNNFSKAAEYYKKIIDNFPQSSYLAAAYYSLGWCLFQEQSFADALANFKNVENRFPKDALVQDAQFKIIECLYNLKEYAALKESAVAYLKTYVKDTAKVSYLYFYLAEADYYMNNFNESIDEYAKAILSTKDERMHSLSQLGKGWAYLKLKRYQESETEFAGVVPDSLEKASREVLLLGKAILAVETKQLEAAKSLYEELITATSDPVVLSQAYLGKADVLYNAGNYKEAVDIYTLALEKTPGTVPREIVDKMHYGLAWVFLKEGEFKKAIEEFQKLAQRTEDKIIKITTLCQIGDAYQDAGDYPKAIETYDGILKDYSDSLYGDYVQYQLGLTMLKSGNYPGAILAFQSLKTNFPQSKLLDEASYALGLSYFQSEDYKASREVFERFPREFKDSKLKSQAAYLCGTSLFNLGDFPAAIEVFKEIIKNYPNDTELVQKSEYEIADCYYQTGNEKEAMARFKLLRDKYPSSTLTPEVIWWLGEYYYRHNDAEQAKQYFLSLIKDFPDSSLLPDARYALGSIYEEESDYQAALDNFNKVREQAKSDLAATALIAVADIYAKQNQMELALGTYQDVLKEYANLAHLIYPKIAESYRKIGKYDDAVAFYRKSLDLVPVKEMAHLQFKIAETREAQGKTDEAIQEYLQVTYLYPDNGDLNVRSLLRVASIYESKGNFPEALTIYQKIVAMGAPESKYAQERIDSIGAQKLKGGG